MKDSITQWITDGAVDFIETRDPHRPFFMWTSYTKPHPPFDPCRDFWHLYENIPMPEAVHGDWSQTLETIPQGFMEGCYENTNMHFFGAEQIAATRRAYYAMISQVDYSLGRLFGCLRENDLFKNTWIIFTADHGEMLGDHFMSQKNVFFEGSAHVPLIIVPPLGVFPTQTAGWMSQQKLPIFIQQFWQWPGIEAPDFVQGRNLLEETGERVFFGNSLNKHFCVMEDKWKLIFCTCGGHTLLFDLNTDPMERHNRSDDAECAEKKAHLWKLLLEHTAQYTPEVLKNGEFITTPAPENFQSIKNHWFGFHYHDYSVDTFH